MTNINERNKSSEKHSDDLKNHSEESVPSDQFHKILIKLDLQEVETEKKYLEMSRPNIVGSHRLNWDGFVKFFVNGLDHILWACFGGDVDSYKKKENNRALEKEKEERRRKKKEERDFGAQ